MIYFTYFKYFSVSLSAFYVHVVYLYVRAIYLLTFFFVMMWGVIIFLDIIMPCCPMMFILSFLFQCVQADDCFDRGPFMLEADNLPSPQLKYVRWRPCVFRMYVRACVRASMFGFKRSRPLSCSGYSDISTVWRSEGVCSLAGYNVADVSVCTLKPHLNPQYLCFPSLTKGHFCAQAASRWNLTAAARSERADTGMFHVHNRYIAL
jgi:hypothetical protein